MLRKLRIKFIFINMLIVTLLLCVLLGMVVHSTQTDMVRRSMSTLEVLSKGAYNQPGGRPQNPPEPPAKPPLGEQRLLYFVLEKDASGQIQVLGDPSFDLSSSELVQRLWQQARSSEGPFGTLGEYKLHYYRQADPVERVFFADMSGEMATLNGLYRTCSLVGIASFFAFLAVSIALAHWAVRPVEKSWTAQQQFVADASHELKTPLTVITSNAELLSQPETSEEQRQRYGDNILTMARTMRSLLEKLLDLARADNGQLELNFERLDMSRLCADALLPFEPVFFEKGLSLEAGVEEGIFVKGSGQHLRQVVDILLDNARKYSLSDGEVRLSLRKQGSYQCQLTVENPAEQLSPQDCKNIFRRFYRLDKARSRESGSYGLGLSIAEDLIRRHKGKIRCDWEKGRIRFTVTLPTA